MRELKGFIRRNRNSWKQSCKGLGRLSQMIRDSILALWTLTLVCLRLTKPHSKISSCLGFRALRKVCLREEDLVAMRLSNKRNRIMFQVPSLTMLSTNAIRTRSQNSLQRMRCTNRCLKTLEAGARNPPPRDSTRSLSPLESRIWVTLTPMQRSTFRWS